MTAGEWVALMVGVAGVIAALSAVATIKYRKSLIITCVILVIIAVIMGAISTIIKLLAPTDSTSSSEVPVGFLGTWSGTQFQSEQPPPMYPTTMTFNAGRRNDEIGIADYSSPEVNCTFSLKLIDATVASMDASASVIKGHCIGPEMRFTLLGPGSVKYDLYYEGRRVGYGNLSKDQM